MADEPRSVVPPAERPTAAGNIGVPLVGLPARLLGGTAIQITRQGLGATVSLDIGKLNEQSGLDPAETWVPCWTESGHHFRVPVNIIPVDAPIDGAFYGRRNGAWEDVSTGLTLPWGSVTEKPATFPPTLPIAQSGIDGLPDALINLQNAIDAVALSVPSRATNATPDADITAFMTTDETANRISQQVYPTRAELLARNLPGVQSRVRTSGRDLPFDGGDGEYEISGSAPVHGDFFVQPNGNIFVDKSRDHTPERLGAIGDGAAHSSNSDKIKEWLLAAAYDGRVAVAPSGRTYIVGDTVEALIDRPLDIRLGSGVIIKGDAGPGAVLRIKNTGGDVRPHLRMAGLAEINNSLRTLVPGTASGTALELIRLGHFYVNGLALQGATGFGDSGIAAEQCSKGVIDACRFYDQSDIGAYLTGGGSLLTDDDGGDIKLVNSHFERCTIAASARRGLPRTIMSVNTVVDCATGFQTTEAQSGVTWLPPGRETLISSNIFKNIGGAAVDLRVAAKGSRVESNIIIDPSQSSAASAIGLLGTDGVACVDNSIVRSTGPANGAAAISVNNYTDQGGTVNTSVDNEVSGNKIVGSEVGVRNLGSLGAVTVRRTNPMTGVTTPYTGSIGAYPHQTTTGFGVGTVAPATPLHVVGKTRVERSGVPTQYVEEETTAVAALRVSYSPTTGGKSLVDDVTTDASNTPPSSGNNDRIFRTRGVNRLTLKDTGQARFHPLTADPARAEESDIYYNSTTKKYRFYNGTAWADI